MSPSSKVNSYVCVGLDPFLSLFSFVTLGELGTLLRGSMWMELDKHHQRTLQILNNI